MIELHVLRLSDDGSQVLLAAHPEAETAGYFVAAGDALRDLVGTSGPARVDEAYEESVAEEAEPEPEPVYELPRGPLDVGDPAEALETAQALRLVRLPASRGPERPVGAEEAEAGLEEAEGAVPGGDETEDTDALAANGSPTVPLDLVSDLGLHDSVLANLHKWNVRIPNEILDEGWWVTKLGDQAWQISFRFLSRGRIHEAEWVLDTVDAVLVPENDLAAMLGWWKPQRARKARRRRGGRSRKRSSGRRRTGASA